MRAWRRQRDDSTTAFPWVPSASSARGAATAIQKSAGWVSGGSGASEALVAAALAKMVWRYDDGQNCDLKEEEGTPADFCIAVAAPRAEDAAGPQGNAVVKSSLQRRHALTTTSPPRVIPLPRATPQRPCCLTAGTAFSILIYRIIHALAWDAPPCWQCSGVCWIAAAVPAVRQQGR